MPADWGKKELVWTLTTKGKTERAYGTLREDSLVDNLVQASEQGAIGAGISSPEIRANLAADAHARRRRSPRAGRAAADARSPLRRTTACRVRVSVPIRAKRAWLPRPVPAPPTRTPPAPTPRGTMAFDPAAQRPPSAITVGSQTGLRHSCFVYRGAGRVTFTPTQAKVWEDTRAGANSPWAPRWMAPAVPADGKYTVSANFEDPGTYTIRCLASDGALNTPKDVVVTVTK